MIRSVLFAGLTIVGGVAATASAEPVSLKAVMSPKPENRGDLPTSPPHFVLFVKREGRASGSVPLDGAEVTE